MNLSYTIQTRRNFIQLVESLNLKQLNNIPKGFKNNVIWNFGHVIVTQQILCYKLAGISPRISQEHIEMFKKGSAPYGDFEQVDVSSLIELAESLLESFETDLKQLDFGQFTTYTTSFNVTLTSIEEAIEFNAIHEGLHYGYAMAMKHLL